MSASAQPDPERAKTMRALQRAMQKPSAGGIAKQAIRSDLESLNGLLPDGGFPTASLVEWISELPGLSATTIALHCIRPFLKQPGCLAVVDSRHEFHALAAQAAGIPLRRLLLIRPENQGGPQNAASHGTRGGGVISGASVAPGGTESVAGQAVTGGVRGARRERARLLQKETLWALEQAARSPGVRVVLCALDRVSSTALRRLQLAVERSGVTVFLLRPASVLNQPSWADLRLHVSTGAVPCAQDGGSSAVPSPSSARERVVAVSLLKARQAVVQQRQQVLLKIDDETGAVFTIPELANPTIAPAAASSAIATPGSAHSVTPPAPHDGSQQNRK